MPVGVFFVQLSKNLGSVTFSVSLLVITVTGTTIDLYRTLKKNETYYSDGNTRQKQWMLFNTGRTTRRIWCNEILGIEEHVYENFFGNFNSWGM